MTEDAKQSIPIDPDCETAVDSIDMMWSWSCPKHGDNIRATCAVCHDEWKARADRAEMAFRKLARAALPNESRDDTQAYQRLEWCAANRVLVDPDSILAYVDALRARADRLVEMLKHYGVTVADIDAALAKYRKLASDDNPS